MKTQIELAEEAVAKFRSKYGAFEDLKSIVHDEEELRGVALLGAVKGSESWDPDRGELESHVYFSSYYSLMDHLKSEVKQRRIFSAFAHLDIPEEDEEPDPPKTLLRNELSDLVAQALHDANLDREEEFIILHLYGLENCIQKSRTEIIEDLSISRQTLWRKQTSALSKIESAVREQSKELSGLWPTTLYQ